MKIRVFTMTLAVMYAVGLAFLLYAAWQGMDYYLMPVIERPHAELHAMLKPGGSWGHGLGILGTAMILLLFLYSARKRELLGLRAGSISRWLDIHIWFGIMGPLYITLHTAMKFNGIVSISYFSMLAVMLSGFVGRYIYIQIPRDHRGTAMTVDEINRTIAGLNQTLGELYGMNQTILEKMSKQAVLSKGARRGRLGDLLKLVASDLYRPIRNRSLRRLITHSHPDMPEQAVREVFALAKQRSLLIRRRALLESVNAVFHLWHVVHKPFAIVMIVIMLVHVAVAVLMGYTWVW